VIWLTALLAVRWASKSASAANRSAAFGLRRIHSPSYGSLPRCLHVYASHRFFLTAKSTEHCTSLPLCLPPAWGRIHGPSRLPTTEPIRSLLGPVTPARAKYFFKEPLSFEAWEKVDAPAETTRETATQAATRFRCGAGASAETDRPRLRTCARPSSSHANLTRPRARRSLTLRPLFNHQLSSADAIHLSTSFQTTLTISAPILD